MAKSHDDNEQNSVVDRVQDSIVANSKSVALSPTQWSRGRWTRVLSKKFDGPLDTRLRRVVNRSKFA